MPGSPFTFSPRGCTIYARAESARKRKRVKDMPRVVIVALSAVALLVALYAFLTAPSRRSRRVALPPLYAHRGLHGDGASENSLEAFERACRAGVGIELDVRFTADGEVVVFHDDALARMCGAPQRVSQTPLAELRRLALPDGSRVPTLEEALACVAGRVPLLVEIKTCRNICALSAETLRRLRAYAGEVAVESFNPLALAYLRRHAPQIPRGQLVSQPDAYRGTAMRVGARAMSNLLANCLSRPDFIAYSHFISEGFAMRVQRGVYRTPCAVWTARERALLLRARERGESVIFEIGQGEDPIRLDDLRP